MRLGPLWLLVLVAGCGNKSASKRGPETYQYSLAMGPRFNANPNIKIRVNGKDAGTNSSFVVPREVELGDSATKLEAVFESTCGPETFALASVSSASDEARERERNPTGTISWRASAPDTMLDDTDVYLDNKWGKPATIEIGNKSFSVGDLGTQRVKVAFGTCATGRTVKIAGKAVGEVPPLEPHWAALVSTTQDMCYVQGSVMYGSEIYEPEKPHVFKLPGHVGKVPVTDYALVEPPESEVGHTGQVARMASVLISMPCELVSASERKGKRTK